MSSQHHGEHLYVFVRHEDFPSICVSEMEVSGHKAELVVEYRKTLNCGLCFFYHSQLHCHSHQDVGSTKLPPDRLMLMEDDKLKGLQFIADTTDTGDAAKRSIIQNDKSTKSNLITTPRIHRPYSVGISYAPDA